MKVVFHPKELLPFPNPIALTLGVCDGVHLGHQMLIHKMKEKGHPVLVLFSPTPDEIFRTAPPMITNLPKRLELLKEFGMEGVIIMPFKLEFKDTSYFDYLRDLHKELPFDFFFLGEGDSIGKNGEGTFDKIKEAGSILGFEAISVSKVLIDRQIVSSSLIRKMFKKGEIAKGEKYLGHPLSFSLTIGSLLFDKDLIKSGTYRVLIQVNESSHEESIKIDRQGRFELPFIENQDPHQIVIITFLT